MVEIPSREELYALVDERFRAEHPDAPERLSRDRPEERPLRARWLSLRDDLLEKEANRIYWANYPDAPLQIDPHDPAHDHFQRAWLDIRDRILQSAPEPAEADGDGAPAPEPADTSYLRAAVNEKLVGQLPWIRPDLQDEVQAYAARMLADVEALIAAGAFRPGDETWHPDGAEVLAVDDPGHKVTLWGSAWWTETGGVDGFLGVAIDNPVGAEV